MLLWLGSDATRSFKLQWIAMLPMSITQPPFKPNQIIHDTAAEILQSHSSTKEPPYTCNNNIFLVFKKRNQETLKKVNSVKLFYFFQLLKIQLLTIHDQLLLGYINTFQNRKFQINYSLLHPFVKAFDKFCILRIFKSNLFMLFISLSPSIYMVYYSLNAF